MVRILRESGFSEMYVPPAPDDAGCALGAALWSDHIHFGNAHVEVPDHPYWGPQMDPDGCRSRRRPHTSTFRRAARASALTRLPHRIRRGIARRTTAYKECCGVARGCNERPDPRVARSDL
jgi:carbamoyltransferase